MDRSREDLAVAGDRPLYHRDVEEGVRVEPPDHGPRFEALEARANWAEEVLPSESKLTVREVLGPDVLLELHDGVAVFLEDGLQRLIFDPAPLPVLGGLDGLLVKDCDSIVELQKHVGAE